MDKHQSSNINIIIRASHKIFETQVVTTSCSTEKKYQRIIQAGNSLVECD